MFTKKLFLVLVIGFLNLVSVDAKERSNITEMGPDFVGSFQVDMYLSRWNDLKQKVNNFVIINY